MYTGSPTSGLQVGIEGHLPQGYRYVYRVTYFRVTGMYTGSPTSGLQVGIQGHPLQGYR